MSDLRIATGTPALVALAGRTYEVGALSMGELGRLQRWVDAHTPPDPVAELKAMRDDLDPALYKLLMGEAMQRKAAGTSVVLGGGMDVLTKDDEGRRLLFAAALKKHQPALPDEEVAAAYDAATLREVMRVFSLAVGLDEPEAGTPGPKAAVVANGVG